jgi:ATP-dependent Clp protease protease subunit
MSRRKGTDNAWFDYNVDPNYRTIFFGSVDSMSTEGSGVDHYSVQLFIKGLVALDLAAPDGDRPIKVIMNSPGGQVYEAMAAYDAIRGCKNEVHIMVLGHVMSAAAIILQASTRRIMSPNATMMIHAGTDGFHGHPVDLQRAANESKRIEKLTDGILLARIRERHPKFTEKKLRDLTLFDTFLTARQAVDLGLADEVFGE